MRSSLSTSPTDAILFGRRVGSGWKRVHPEQRNTICRRPILENEIPVRETSARLKRLLNHYVSLKGRVAVSPIVGQVILISAYFLLEDINIVFPLNAAGGAEENEGISVREIPPEHLPFFAALNAVDDGVGWHAVLDLASNLTGLSPVALCPSLTHSDNSRCNCFDDETMKQGVAIVQTMGVA